MDGLDYLTTKTKFMSTQLNEVKPARTGLVENEDFLPISLKTAVTQVQNFRSNEKNGRGYGVIFEVDNIMHYLCHHYQAIVNRQPDPIAAGYEGYEWGLGHFFMELDNGELDFCMAPVLFRKDRLTGKTSVVDPFDPNCSFPYTYNQKMVSTNPDDEVDIYDMGEMWP